MTSLAPLEKTLKGHTILCVLEYATGLESELAWQNVYCLSNTTPNPTNYFFSAPLFQNKAH